MDDMEVIVFEDLPSEKTPIDADNLNKMQENAKKAIKNRKPTIELLTVSSAAPSECNIGDKYYNTTISKIYTAIATNTWGTEGENPSSLYLYADLEHKELYYYDGTDFKSYGSGKKEVGYADEQLEGTEVILIEDSDFNGENSVELAKVEQNLSSNSENTVPSVKAVNDAIKTNIITGQEVATNVYIGDKQVFLKRINFGALPNASEKIVATDLKVSEVELYKFDGLGIGSAGNVKYVITLPDTNPSAATQATRITFDSLNNFYRIKITTGVDRTNYTAKINIYYTKNT